jgi:hypothetical protein
MACPRCGGTARRQIAPGFYQCEELVRDWEEERRRGGLWDRVCGNRYQDGGAAAGNTPKCWCGVYAIAECSDCGAPLCGDHIERYERRVICRYDLDKNQRAGREQAAEKSERQLDIFLARLSEISSGISDPVGKTVCIAISRSHMPPDESGRGSSEIREMLGDVPPMFDTATLDVIAVASFLSWAFRHPQAKVETFPVSKYSRLLRRQVQVGSFRALCRNGRPVLLADGSEPGWSGAYLISDQGYHKRDSHYPPTRISSTGDLLRFAEALDIPYVPYGWSKIGAV